MRRKTLSLSDCTTGQLLSEVVLLHMPTSVLYMSPGASSSTAMPLLTERATVSLWDPRQRTCVNRHNIGAGSLYASASCGDQVAVAGVSRSVHLFDIRKWGQHLAAWRNCLKYEAAGLQFSSLLKRLYVVGIDSELAVAALEGNLSLSKLGNTLADSRWLGCALNQQPTTEAFVGITERSIYWMDQSWKKSVPTQDDADA
jgi:hypothetical protein